MPRRHCLRQYTCVPPDGSATSLTGATLGCLEGAPGDWRKLERPAHDQNAHPRYRAAGKASDPEALQWSGRLG